MDSRLHLMLAVTLSMIMTFGLNCVLKDSQASGNLLQVYVVDLTRDYALFARCLLNNITDADAYSNLSNDYTWRARASLVLLVAMEASFVWVSSEKKAYFLGGVSSIFMGWLLVRFCDAFHLWCQMDVVTVYFLIGQWTLIRLQWQLKTLPVISTTTCFYRGYLCMAMASNAFIMHDIFFRYSPGCVSLAFFWTFAFLDLFVCLHPRGYLYRGISLAPPSDALDRIEHYYSTGEPDENGHIDRSENVTMLGFGDFLFYNLMLLWILPPLSSVTTQAYVAIGHIIAVHIGGAISDELGTRYGYQSYPGLPAPIVAVSLYALVLDVFMK